MPAVRAALAGAGLQGLVHDLPDGAGAASALSAAAKAAIDLAGRKRSASRVDCGPDITVGQDVAGADDHGMVPYVTIP